MQPTIMGAMKHGSNPRRGRTRGNGKRHPSSKGQSIESNGPEMKVRGTAQQVHEKYLALARDAFSAGDRIAAEGYFQYAEHYHRIHRAEHGGGYNDRRGNRAPPGQPTAPPAVKAAGTAPAAEPAKPADPAEPAETAETAEPTEPTEPAEPTEPGPASP